MGNNTAAWAKPTSLFNFGREGIYQRLDVESDATLLMAQRYVTPPPEDTPSSPLPTPQRGAPPEQEGVASSASGPPSFVGFSKGSPAELFKRGAIDDACLLKFPTLLRCQGSRESPVPLVTADGQGIVLVRGADGRAHEVLDGQPIHFLGVGEAQHALRVYMDEEGVVHWADWPSAAAQAMHAAEGGTAAVDAGGGDGDGQAAAAPRGLGWLLPPWIRCLGPGTGSRLASGAPVQPRCLVVQNGALRENSQLVLYNLLPAGRGRQAQRFVLNPDGTLSPLSAPQLVWGCEREDLSEAELQQEVVRKRRQMHLLKACVSWVFGECAEAPHLAQLRDMCTWLQLVLLPAPSVTGSPLGGVAGAHPASGVRTDRKPWPGGEKGTMLDLHLVSLTWRTAEVQSRGQIVAGQTGATGEVRVSPSSQLGDMLDDGDTARDGKRGQFQIHLRPQQLSSAACPSLWMRGLQLGNQDMEEEVMYTAVQHTRWFGQDVVNLVQLGGALSEGEGFELCAMLTAPRLAGVLLLNFLQADRFALLFHAKMRATLTCALFEFGAWSSSAGANIEQIPVPCHAEAEMCGTASGKLRAQLCGGCHAVLQPFLKISARLCELAVVTQFGSSASSVLLFVVRTCVRLHGFLLSTPELAEAGVPPGERPQTTPGGHDGSPARWLEQIRLFMSSALRPKLLEWLRQITERRSVRDMLMLHSHLLLLESQLCSAAVSDDGASLHAFDWAARILASASFLHAFQCEASTAADAVQQQEATAGERSQEKLGWREQLAIEKLQQEKLEQRRAEEAIETEALEAVHWALEAWHEAAPRVLRWFDVSTEAQQRQVLELATQCVLLQGTGAVPAGSDGAHPQPQLTADWERQGSASSLQFVDEHRGIVLQVWCALLIQLDSSSMQLVPREVVDNPTFHRLFHRDAQSDTPDEAQTDAAEADSAAHWCSSVTIRSDSRADDVPMWQVWREDAAYYIVKHDSVAAHWQPTPPVCGSAPERLTFHGSEWQPADMTSEAALYLRVLLRIECGAAAGEWDLYTQVPSPTLRPARHIELLVCAADGTQGQQDEKAAWLLARVWFRGDSDSSRSSSRRTPSPARQPYMELWELQSYMGTTHPHLIYTSDISQSWATAGSRQLSLSTHHWVRSPLCLRNAHGNLLACVRSSGAQRRRTPELLLWRVPRQARSRQHLLTPELLQGVLPELLVEQFDFWLQDAGDTESSGPLTANIIGYSRSQQCFDYTIHATLSPTAPAVVAREVKEGGVTVQQHLLNPQLMSAGSAAHTVWQLMTALEDNSHCLIWGAASEEGELTVAVAELPRLQLRFTLEGGCHTAPQQGSQPALFCGECGGLSVSYCDAADDDLQRLRRSFPRSLLLSDAEHRLFLLLPDHTPHLLPRPAEAHGATSPSLAMDVALKADEARWATQGDSRYFLLQVDGLRTCLIAPTRAAAMYCCLLQLLSGEYAQAMRSLDACAANHPIVPYERWVLSMVAQSTRDLHPNAIACRLRLASVALDLNLRGGSVAEDHDVLFHVPWELKADVVAYVQRLPLVRSPPDLCMRIAHRERRGACACACACASHTGRGEVHVHVHVHVHRTPGEEGHAHVQAHWSFQSSSPAAGPCRACKPYGKQLARPARSENFQSLLLLAVANPLLMLALLCTCDR